MDEYTKVLLIQDNEPVRDREAINLVVKAIYHNSPLENEIPQICDYVIGNLQLMSHQDSLFAILQKYFIDQLNNGQLWRPDIFEGMRILTLHAKETSENRRSYMPDGRANPEAVFWPDPTHKKYPRSLFNELPYAETYNFIDKTTPIGSAGSCFAMEIAHRFQKAGYNYVVTERRGTLSSDPKPQYANASAAWGILFNVPAQRQLIEKAFGVKKMPKLLWKNTYKGKEVYCDPFREDVLFETVEQYEMEHQAHIDACREVFLKCKVFIMTMGLIEAWFLKSDGTVFSRSPWNVSSVLTERRVLTVDENIQHMEAAVNLLRRYNPEVKIIVTVSPVPLHATFRGDSHHVVTSTCHSKAVLRVAAEEFVRRNKDAYYFPSYEKVMYCTDHPWEPDQRHVARKTVDGVMRLFSKMFLKDTMSTELYDQSAPVNCERQLSAPI